MGSEYLDSVLKRADDTESIDLQATLVLAGYVHTRRTVRASVVVDSMDKITDAWRCLKGWLEDTVQIDNTGLAEAIFQIEEIVGITKHFAHKCGQIEVHKSLIIDHLWTVVSLTSDRKVLEHLLSAVEPHAAAHTMWQVMALRLAVKRTLLMLEYDADDFWKIERF